MGGGRQRRFRESPIGSRISLWIRSRIRSARSGKRGARDWRSEPGRNQRRVFQMRGKLRRAATPRRRGARVGSGALWTGAGSFVGRLERCCFGPLPKQPGGQLGGGGREICHRYPIVVRGSTQQSGSRPRGRSSALGGIASELTLGSELLPPEITAVVGGIAEKGKMGGKDRVLCRRNMFDSRARQSCGKRCLTRRTWTPLRLPR